MSKFMGWLRDAMGSVKPADITETTGAFQEVQEGEEVIGVLESVELRRMNVVMMRLSQSLVELVKKAAHQAVDRAVEGASTSQKSEHDSATCPSCSALREAKPLVLRVEKVRNLFWDALREELPPDAQEKVGKMGLGIGIREGWQIVAMPCESEPEISIAGLGFGMPPFGILLGAMRR